MKIANAIWAEFLLIIKSTAIIMVFLVIAVAITALLIFAFNIPLYRTSTQIGGDAPSCELLESEEGRPICKPAPKAPAPSSKAFKKAQEKTENRLAK